MYNNNQQQCVSSPTLSQEILKIIRMILSLGIRAINADEGALLIYNAAKHDLTFTEIAGVAPKNILGQKVKLGEGVTGNACLLQETQIGSRNNSGQMKDVKGDGTPFSVLAVPILIDEQLWGCMTAVRFTDGAIFNSQDADLYNKFVAILITVVSQQVQINACKNESAADNHGEQSLEEYFSDFIARHHDQKASIFRILKSIDEFKG